MMARELATMAGHRSPQKVTFPAFELGSRGEALASPSPSIQSDLQLTVTVDPEVPQRPQEHEFQLQGKAITPALGYVRQTFSTEPFSFDANGEATVVGKIHSEAVASFSRPSEPMPDVSVVLRCKVE